MDTFAQAFGWCCCVPTCDSSDDPARSHCCGSKTPGGPLDSDKFEREVHREIAELKARSRIRKLEAEQRQLQQSQPDPTEDMVAKPEL